MEINFLNLRLTNFKNHQSLNIDFGDMTNIAGRNGAGKSSIGEAFTWILYGVDMMGTKTDPTPLGSNSEVETKGELLLKVDDKQVLLGRALIKGKANYYINEVPEKATKFNETVESLFDKNLFLSLFNPTYFSSQKWQDQRSQLLQYVSEPLNKEVLAEMDAVSKGYLEERLKKHSSDDLEKIHRDRYNKSDKAYERASERVLTLKEQLDRGNEEIIDVKKLKEQMVELVFQRDALDKKNQELYQTNSERARIESQIESLQDQINRQKKVVENIKNEEIQENCNTCGQALDEASIQKVKENKQSRFNKEIATGRELVSKLNSLKTTLDSLPETIQIDRSESYKLDDQVMEIKSKLDAVNRVEILKREVAEAEENKEKIRQERNESMGIVAAVKEFKTERASLMIKKIDDLFTNISVKLFDLLKNEDLRPTFEITMNGKPYSKLSTAEKIKAGLEVIEVLSNQSDVIAPTFVDNAESILHFTKPSGQLISARVVDSELTIKTQEVKQ